MTTEKEAAGTENLASVAWAAVMASATMGLAVHFGKRCRPNPFSQPATTDMKVSATNGPVMRTDDSCGCPSPRYSPKKVNQMQRPMYAAVKKAPMSPTQKKAT